MLLIGETGSGKTSFLNLVSNMQQVHKIGYEKSAKSFRKFNNIKYEKQAARKMESATIGSNLYEVQFDGVKIQIIDTPGFGDTRGLDVDKKNVKDIVTKVNEVDYMHCICFLINGRQARVTTQFQYIASEIAAVLPKMSVKNVIVVCTNSREEEDSNIDIKELTTFLSEEIPKDHVFYLDNPYCKLEKLKSKKQDQPIEVIANDLKASFVEASETLTKLLTTVTQLSKLETSLFMKLYLMKEAVESATLELMVACQNEAELWKVIEKQKKDIDDAVTMKNLFESFKNSYSACIQTRRRVHRRK